MWTLGKTKLIVFPSGSDIKYIIYHDGQANQSSRIALSDDSVFNKI